MARSNHLNNRVKSGLNSAKGNKRVKVIHNTQEIRMIHLKKTNGRMHILRTLIFVSGQLTRHATKRKFLRGLMKSIKGEKEVIGKDRHFENQP